jgi:uncharacterized phage protein (TIGR01671 family)
MREIKFRAWDVENKKWFINKNPQGNDFTRYVIDFDGYLWVKDYDDSFSKNQYILMQYTGLKDYYKQEIYEGDILTFTEVDEDSCCGAEETHVGTISWIESSASFRFVYKSGRRRELYLITDFQQISECKVIGNIYENPELLK